jgi:Protein of unknown function (DUF2628)
MPIYTVHEPPLRRYEIEPDPVRFAFVRDGFSFWAFVLGAIWMLRYRLWLVLIAYIILVAAIGIGLHVVGAPAGARLLVVFLVALLFGLEATTLRRWTLSRRGWVNLGVVTGSDQETAERRFFDAWVASGGSGYTLPIPPPPATPRNDGAPPGVIGLFPEPGARA